MQQLTSIIQSSKIPVELTLPCVIQAPNGLVVLAFDETFVQGQRKLVSVVLSNPSNATNAAYKQCAIGEKHVVDFERAKDHYKPFFGAITIDSAIKR